MGFTVEREYKNIGEYEVGPNKEYKIIVMIKSGLIPDDAVIQRVVPKVTKHALNRKLKVTLRPSLMARQKDRCAVCGKHQNEFKRRFDIHRIKPGSQGGAYTISNTIAVCPKCHKKVEGLSIEQLEPLLHKGGTDAE